MQDQIFFLRILPPCVLFTGLYWTLLDDLLNFNQIHLLFIEFGRVLPSFSDFNDFQRFSPIFTEFYLALASFTDF